MSDWAKIEEARKRMGIKDIFFWKGKDKTLYVIRLRKTVLLYLTGDKPPLPHLRVGPGADYMAFSREEFAALLRDLVKYILDMPELSVRIPSKITGLDVPHGIICSTKLVRSGKNGGAWLKLDPRFLKALELEGVKELKWVKRRDGWVLVPKGMRVKA